MDMKRFFPTEEQEQDFFAYKDLRTEEEKKIFFKEREERYNRKSETEKAAYDAASMAGLKAIREKMEDLKRELDEIKMSKRLGEIPKMISLSYLATHYFKKSRSWLYQRINNNKVNGKRATFTEEEKKLLAEALQDMAEKIKNTSLTLC
ncbi:MAG: DUF5053 domain-containing protein [Odoribacteraceae bacterium]|jgi:hypothetical protein|nr:DUF5053 domain-containing protein [Odoribacteraceae bacterium]